MTSRETGSKNAFKEVDRIELIQRIKEQVDNGYGVVPFLGSGVSLASGIMTGAELRDYLIYVIYSSIKSLFDQEQNSLGDVKKSINQDYRVDALGWPELPTNKDKEESIKWLNLLYKFLNKRGYKNRCFSEQAVKKRNGGNFERIQDEYTEGVYISLYMPKSGVSRNSIEYILNCAVRSLGDWRDMLQFIARLEIEDERVYKISENCNQSIIDAMNAFMVKGRKPNLSHFTLCHLVYPLRVRRFLTTNFDDLLELAMRQVRQRFDVFSVERNSRLPDANNIANKMGIIKLHGSLHETRADHTLDIPPEEKDKKTFLRYFVPEARHGDVGTKSCLLVMGYSFYDKRIIELVKYVLNYDRDIKIFFVAHDLDCMKYLKSAFGDEYKERFYICEVKRLDIFLVELYSALTKSLPSGGFTHQYIHYVPPIFDGYDLFGWPERKELYESFKEDLKNKKDCYWHEGDDYHSFSDLIVGWLSTVAIRHGYFHCEYLNFDYIHEIGNEYKQNPQKMLKDLGGEINRVLDSIGVQISNIRLYINGTNGNGYSTGWEVFGKGKWTQQDEEKLEAFVKEFGLDDSNGVNDDGRYVKYLPLGDKRKKILLHQVSNIAWANDEIKEELSEYLESAFAKVNGSLTTPETNKIAPVYDGLEDLVSDNGDELNLLHALSLFRESRNKAFLNSTSLYKGSHFIDRHGLKNEGFENIDKFLSKIIDEKYFYLKDGGYLWTDLANKLVMRKYFKHINRSDWAIKRHSSHFELGELYLEAFHATNHSEPLIESLYHKIQALSCLRDAAQACSQSVENGGDLYHSLKEILWRVLYILYSIVKIIRYSKSSLQFWITENSIRDMFSSKSFIEAFFKNGGEGFRTVCQEICKFDGATNSFCINEEQFYQFESQDNDWDQLLSKTYKEEPESAEKWVGLFSFFELSTKVDGGEFSSTDEGNNDDSKDDWFDHISLCVAESFVPGVSEPQARDKPESGNELNYLYRLIYDAFFEVYVQFRKLNQEIHKESRLSLDADRLFRHSMPIKNAGVSSSNVELIASTHSVPLDNMKFNKSLKELLEDSDYINDEIYKQYSSTRIKPVNSESGSCGDDNGYSLDGVLFLGGESEFDMSRLFSYLAKGARNGEALSLSAINQGVEILEIIVEKARYHSRMARLEKMSLFQEILNNEKYDNTFKNDFDFELSEFINKLKALQLSRESIASELNSITSYVKKKIENDRAQYGDSLDKYFFHAASSIGLWGIARDLSILYLELLRFVHPVFVYTESTTKVQLLTIRSLCVSRLVSNSEKVSGAKADSLLNQASALIFIQPVRDSINYKAVIDMRRAEYYAHKSAVYKGDIKSIIYGGFKDGGGKCISSFRNHASAVENAHLLLDSAESLLSGNSHSLSLWSRLYLQRFNAISAPYILMGVDKELLSCFADSEFILVGDTVLSAARMKNCDPKYLKNLLIKSLSVCGEHTYIKLCMINAYVRAVRKVAAYRKLVFSGDVKPFVWITNEVLERDKLGKQLLALNGKPIAKVGQNSIFNEYEEFARKISKAINLFQLEHSNEQA